MSSLESQLLAEITRMQSSLSVNQPVATTPTPVISTFTEADVRRIAQDVLAEELNALKNSLNLGQSAPTHIPETTQPTIQDAVNLALNEEERNWLLQNNNYATIEEKLPQFLMTEDGQLAIQSLLLYLRG